MGLSATSLKGPHLFFGYTQKPPLFRITMWAQIVIVSLFMSSLDATEPGLRCTIWIPVVELWMKTSGFESL